MSSMSVGLTVALPEERAASAGSFGDITGLADEKNCVIVTCDRSWLPDWASVLSDVYSVPDAAYLGAEFVVLRSNVILSSAAAVHEVLNRFARDPLALFSRFYKSETMEADYIEERRLRVEAVLGRPPEIPMVENYCDGYESDEKLASFLFAHLAILRFAASHGFVAVNSWHVG